jgi:peptidoglycan/LPS O-acetylase OafA/YrhL
VPVPVYIQNKNRIEELDGLRGIAILLVIGFHYVNNQLVNSDVQVGKILSKLTSFGWVGVDLFFVLSGFLIGNILIHNRGSKNFFRTFFLRRLLRIVPNYYLLIIVFIVICQLPYFQQNIFLTGHNTLPVWSYFTMFHNLFMASTESMGNAAMSITWSIGIEEQFYIIFPFIVFLAKPKWLPAILIGAVLLAPVFRNQYNSWIPPYVLLFCRMDALAMGILVAYAFANNKFAGMGKAGFWVIISIMAVDAIICACLFLKYEDIGVLRNTLFAVFFAGCLILALTQQKTLYGAILRNKLLIWIGTLSYSLYLFHYLILGLFHHVSGQNAPGIYDMKGIWVSIAALLASLAVAWLVYRKLETPMVAFGKKFKYN